MLMLMGANIEEVGASEGVAEVGPWKDVTEE